MKGEWSGNRLDLNPIEELWSIGQQDVDKQKPGTSLAQLETQLKSAWSLGCPKL